MKIATVREELGWNIEKPYTQKQIGKAGPTYPELGFSAIWAAFFERSVYIEWRIGKSQRLHGLHWDVSTGLLSTVPALMALHIWLQWRSVYSECTLDDCICSCDSNLHLDPWRKSGIWISIWDIGSQAFWVGENIDSDSLIPKMMSDEGSSVLLLAVGPTHFYAWHVYFSTWNMHIFRYIFMYLFVCVCVWSTGMGFGPQFKVAWSSVPGWLND